MVEILHIQDEKGMTLIPLDVIWDDLGLTVRLSLNPDLAIWLHVEAGILIASVYQQGQVDPVTIDLGPVEKEESSGES